MDLTTRRVNDNTETFINSMNPNEVENNNGNNNINHVSNGNKARSSKSIFSIRSIMDVEDDQHSTEITNTGLTGEHFIFVFLNFVTIHYYFGMENIKLFSDSC